MADSDLSERVILGASDVDVRPLGDRRFEIIVGPRTYVLAADDGASLESLREAIVDLVPRLRRTAPLREQLSAEETARLAPHLDRLTDLGVLLFPAAGAGVCVTTQAELGLYSFISRRTGAPDQVFASVRAKGIDLRAGERVRASWVPLLRAQGLRVTTAGDDVTADPPGATPALTIVVSSHEETLAEANRVLCARGNAWLPVHVAARRVRVGPWVLPGESACHRCLTLPGPVASETREPSRASALTAAEAPDAAVGRFTAQPGLLGWVGGLIAHMALRALMPMDEPPWGRVTAIDAVRCAQTSFRGWRDPYCPDCARPAPMAQVWAEL